MSYHMTPDEFRMQGHAAIEWVARYMEEVEKYPVLSQVEPGDIRAKLPPHPPQEGESMEAVLRDMDEIIMPGITHWQSPNFFAYFPSNTSGASIIGDLLSSGINAQGMMWNGSPAYTELETHVMDWLVELLDLPERFSSRRRRRGRDRGLRFQLDPVRRAGRPRAGHRPAEQPQGLTTAAWWPMPPPRLTRIWRRTSASPASAATTCAASGVDDSYAMRPDLLEEAIQADLEAGRKPFLVVATVGTTSSNAFDPLPAIGEICRRHGLWMHVDGAMCGTAAVAPEYRWVNKGLELADSYCLRIRTSGCSPTSTAAASSWPTGRRCIGALSILPEYLRNAASASGAVIDYRDWQIPLGRRFRALKLWSVIRHYGVEGLRFHVRQHVALAQEFKHWVLDHPDFDLAAPAPLNLVCFRHRAGDAVTQAIMDRVNASGHMFLSHTKLDDRLVLRLCVGQAQTEARHVRQAWELLQEAGAASATS